MKPRKITKNGKALTELLEWNGWMAGYISFEASREVWNIKAKYPLETAHYDWTGYYRGAAYSRRSVLKECGLRLPKMRSVMADAVWRGRRSAREYWNTKHPNGPNLSEQSCRHAG